MSPSPLETRVAGFVARYTPEMAAAVRTARRQLRALFPRGYELIYDNYNALVFGYGPSEKASEALISIAAYPRWLTLFFLHGAGLNDPHGLLQGGGTRVRGVVLSPAVGLDDPRVRALIDEALLPHGAAFAAAPRRTTVIRSVSEKRRSRRPPPGAAGGTACVDAAQTGRARPASNFTRKPRPSAAQ